MLDWTYSETPLTLGSVTYEPPPAPFEVRIRLCAASTRSASRTVARLTPKSVASTASFGSRSSGLELAVDDALTKPLGNQLVLPSTVTRLADAELAVAGDRRGRDSRTAAAGRRSSP